MQIELVGVSEAAAGLHELTVTIAADFFFLLDKADPFLTVSTVQSSVKKIECQYV